MRTLQPRQTRFDLKCRAAGVPLRVNPLFWLSSAILGVRYLADPEAGSWGYFLFWMAAVLASVLLHEAGHVFAGRLFGMRGEVVLSGLGGMTLGLNTLSRRWQRLVVLLAGPAIQLVVVAAVWAATWSPFPQVFRDWGWQGPIATGTAILLRINYDWALLNLLPLWPLDGGRIAVDVGEGLFGERGKTAALVLSVIASGLLALWMTLELSLRLEFPYDPRYVLHLEQFGVLVLYCFLLWLRGFRELWPEQPTVPSS